MAICQVNFRSIGRSGGGSAVAMGLYLGREKGKDRELNKTYDYTDKLNELVYKEILLPDKVAQKLGKDYISQIRREELWNLVQEIETRKNSQFATEIQISLPKELDTDTNLDLSKKFVKWLANEYNLLADFAIHQDPKDGHNPHLHIMITTRNPIEKNGKLEFSKKKERRIKDVGFPALVRQKWCDFANEYLPPELHISPKSNKELGLPEPKAYLPRAEYERLKRGKPMLLDQNLIKSLTRASLESFSKIAEEYEPTLEYEPIGTSWKQNESAPTRKNARLVDLEYD